MLHMHQAEETNPSSPPFYRCRESTTAIFFRSGWKSELEIHHRVVMVKPKMQEIGVIIKVFCLNNQFGFFFYRNPIFFAFICFSLIFFRLLVRHDERNLKS